MQRFKKERRTVRNYGVLILVLPLCLTQIAGGLRAVSASGFFSSLFPLPSSLLLDTLRFGDPASEQAHGVASTLNETIRGGLNEPARRLLPQNPPTFEGGNLTFTLKVDPAHALPEEQTKHYLYEAVGLVPWLGSDTENGPEKPLGDHYYQLTAGGLTRELGFAGYYGEVLDWVAQLYDITCDPGQTGDPKIKAQLEKITHARAVFRYPMLDANGNRAMRVETIVGWRDAHYPGDITYCERPSWDGTAVYAAALTQDPEAVGSVQQMFADNQFFASLQSTMKIGGLRTTAGLMGAPEQYELLKTLPVSARRLPMSPGQPDFAWADVEDGVVAIKHGSDILYASLYWRARFGINNLARIHYITPRFDRIAVVRQEEQFEPSGMYYTVPDWTDFGFNTGGFHYPGPLHQAQAGEKLPIPKMPEGVKFKSGEENSYAGKADFYACRYGDYLIGMNCTADKHYPLHVPPGISKATDLISGKTVSIKNGSVSVEPKSTLVLYLGRGPPSTIFSDTV